MMKMNDLPDEEVLQLVLAGQIIFAHKAIDSGLMTLEDAAGLLGTDSAYLERQFERLGLEPVKEMTFEDLLNSNRTREMTFTAEEIKKLFFQMLMNKYMYFIFGQLVFLL